MGCGNYLPSSCVIANTSGEKGPVPTLLTAAKRILYVVPGISSEISPGDDRKLFVKDVSGP